MTSSAAAVGRLPSVVDLPYFQLIAVSCETVETIVSPTLTFTGLPTTK